MFAGLRSRWTIPFSWAVWTARASVSTRPAASRAGWGLPWIFRARLPPSTYSTEAIWFCPAAETLDGAGELLGTLHAAEHALIALLPLWAMCDRWDIGGLSTNLHFQTGAPTIFVYDGHPGGVGITERGFDRFEGWVEDTVRLLAGCPCSHGCPSCVQSPKCGNLNEPLDKGGALTLLRRLAGAS